MPSAGTGSPYSLRSPIMRRRTTAITASARSGEVRMARRASSGPIGERSRMFGGVRTASRTRRAPFVASS